MKDVLQNTFEIPINVVVPDSDQLETAPQEMSVPSGIPVRMDVFFVLASVHLNNKLGMKAGEVHNESIDGGLAPEMITALPETPEMMPKLDLLRRHDLTKLARNLIGHREGHSKFAPPGRLRRPTSPSRGGRDYAAPLRHLKIAALDAISPIEN
jgi:hypothetical protein